MMHPPIAARLALAMKFIASTHLLFSSSSTEKDLASSRTCLDTQYFAGF